MLQGTNHFENLSRTLAVSIVFVFLFCGLLSSCAKKTTLSRNGERNYAVENALLNALKEERKIHEKTEGILSEVSSGTVDLPTCFHLLSVQTEKLLSLIDSISEAGEETDRNLRGAKERVYQYIRERIHQIENCLSTASVEDLQAQFFKQEAHLETIRRKAIEKLIDYNPDIKKEL